MTSIKFDMAASAVDMAVSGNPFVLAVGDAHSPTLQHHSRKNVTEPHIWKDIADHIDSLGSRLDRNYSEDDWAMKEHLELFADRIDAKATEIALNTSMLLEEFKSYSSSSPVSLDVSSINNDLPMLGEYYSRLLDTSDEMKDGDSWLQDVQNEVSIIESWELEAEKLSHVAIAAFKNLKIETTNIRETSRREAVSALEKDADALYHETRSSQDEQGLQMKQNNKGRQTPEEEILNHISLWAAGGFKVEGLISHAIALEAIKAMPLKTYKLRDDKQRDLGVRIGERRTRHHVGVVDPGDDREKQMEPASIFSYNIGAVSQLATSLDRLAAASSSSFRFQSSLEDKISTWNKTEILSQNSFKSPRQLASEVAALETEAALTRITRLSQTVLQSTRLNLLNSRFVSRMKSLVEQDCISERENLVERDSIVARESHVEHAGAYLDQILIQFKAANKMNTVFETTKREVFEMYKAAAMESHIAKEEIHAEAVVERENEALSMEHVKLLGKARTDEIIQAIENIFWHLFNLFRHIMTPEGRRQFLFYICSSAALVFFVSTTKELIAVGCIWLLRFFTAPRLVREYGNLSARATPSSHKQAHAMADIVLTPETKERINLLVKVTSAASKRRFPLRSMLIHGKPGTGKSATALAIASATGLPYALMSGADVFPLGSQGPAELKKLLTWANNKCCGAIIIIDEAETALGTRETKKRENNESNTVSGNGSTTCSPGFSRDCLNTFLSMTGNFGNICFILTTNHPKDLDVAVLDRIDEMLLLELPKEKERMALLCNQFLCRFQSAADDRSAVFSKLLRKLLRPSSKAYFAVNFDAGRSISDLASKTDGFSGRELEKIIQGVLHKTYASDTGVLDSAIWEKETGKMIEANKMKKKLLVGRKPVLHP